MNEHVAVIELAAGLGSRFGEQKQFIEFLDKPLWRHIYEKVTSLIPKENVVVVGVDIIGGITRARSVVCGLQYLKSLNKNFKRILVVEAARPLVSVEQLKTIIEDNHLSSTYALPLVSTIVKRDGTYQNREDFYKLSTPVGFDYQMFSAAYLGESEYEFTDDTRVMYEHYGIKPFFIEGDERLLKMTYKSDLEVMQALAKRFSE